MSAVALALHSLFAVVWVGGMFFAYMVLRPSVPGIEAPPERLKLWSRVFPKFFHWVWISVVILPLTGYWLLMDVFGGFAGAAPYIHMMHLTGWLMIVLFAFLYLVPYRAFKAAVGNEDWPGAAAKLDTIRKIVATNLVIGIITVVIGASGRLWP
jgi:uncharacterized membrane protein